MAVYFRHGSNGAYKSAYAVWFEILPALRNGRLVVTNIEGLKPLDKIEKLLGEKFPPGARLIRVFSRKLTGIELWQNWFSWMPIGALVVIDECQDIFTVDAGFKKEKTHKRPIEEFLPNLPDDFADLFHSRWTKVDESTLDEGDIDDTGETQLDEQGRLLYPDHFYGAFMRHRKYQWDIVMLTPDWTSIPTWLRGCAQEAYSHRSTDTWFRKRKPRIYNHSTKATKTAPSTREDMASTTSKKIPVEVFALYKSTGTGKFNESKSDVTMLKSPKFILAMLIGIGAVFKFVWDAYALFYSDTENPTQETAQVTESNSNNTTTIDSQNLDANTSTTQSGHGVGSGGDSHQNSAQVAIDAVNPFYRHFPIFNQARSVYLTSVVRERIEGDITLTNYRFRIDKDDGEYYVSSPVLIGYGYEFLELDECLIQVKLGDTTKMLTCPPRQGLDKPDDFTIPDRTQELKQVDIFNLSGNKEA
ncbi:zonular occludens toxin domain-containing protein (plasmid) [Vibrio tubiashii]|uniref:zonular occludens toxin domain-containing protein n=1 Tax=Vibrio tubiashii TaxID=29498 RepID=UPI00234F5636|nr:zonular occludens toxin domain-containing protein [Vibrio tubiashii]WCP70330.1 zonular occludens toxin domain-containing protein [Vibrio tubiashii]